MQMRESKVLRKLRAGEFTSCYKVNLLDPRSCEIAAIAGFDCIWVDQEHIGQDWSVLAANIWATKSQGVDMLVRVARGAYSDYVRPLELDASGIMVPHIMSLEEAKQVVNMTRFHPLGRRAIDGGNNDAAYTAVDFNEYLVKANEQRFVALQIEDPEPLLEIEAIADLPGYDMLFFGPGDFSQGIGAPGQWDHPDLIAARQKVVATAHKYGKFAGTVGSAANLMDLKNMGYDFVSTGADVVGLTKYCNDLISAFKVPTSDNSGKNYLEN